MTYKINLLSSISNPSYCCCHKTTSLFTVSQKHKLIVLLIHSSVKLCEKQNVELQIKITIIPTFITTHVFAESQSISLYKFKF